MVVGTFMKQFFDYVGKIGRQSLAHLRACVFAGHVATYPNQAVNHDTIPFVNVFFFRLHHFQFLFRIIDQGAKVSLDGVAYFVSEYFVYLSLDIT